MTTAVRDREVSIEPDGRPEEFRSPTPIRHTRHSWRRWALTVLVLLGLGAFALFRMQPLVVSAVAPESQLVAETISSSGVVQGHMESVVASQVPGIVTTVLVEEGDRVTRGQILAKVQSNVAIQQANEARSAVDVAEASLRQVLAGAAASDIRAAQARLRQAQSGIEQFVAGVERARLAVGTASLGVSQARLRLSQARLASAQSAARQELASKNLDRKRSLYAEGAIAAADYDQARSAYDVAVADTQSAQEAIRVADIAVQGAIDAQRSARQDQNAAESQLASARAVSQACEEELKTIRAQPRPEAVAFARNQVASARESYLTAQAQAENTTIVAPFEGTVTDVMAHPGSAATSGVLRLVATNRLEVKVDLDEADVHSVKIGQRAILASGDKELSGKVVRLGSQIDSLRGTLEVYIAPNQTPRWLTAGQTLNVNIVTVERVNRLMIPATAVQREGDRTVVYVLENGRAKQRSVRLGQLVGDRIPVLEGVERSDKVIANALGIAPDASVRPRGR